MTTLPNRMSGLGTILLLSALLPAQARAQEYAWTITTLTSATIVGREKATDEVVELAGTTGHSWPDGR